MNVSDDNFYSSDLNSSGSISVYSFISSSNDSSNSPSVSEPSESDSKGLISGIKWETAKPPRHPCPGAATISGGTAGCHTTWQSRGQTQ